MGAPRPLRRRQLAIVRRGWQAVRRTGRIGGQREWPGIVAAGEFHQRLHPAVDRRVGREQVGKALARVVEA